jgi:hypothetical protein
MWPYPLLCPLLCLSSSYPSFIVRSSLCPYHSVLVVTPYTDVHAARLAVVVGVTSRRSGFPSDTRAKNRRGLLL